MLKFFIDLKFSRAVTFFVSMGLFIGIFNSYTVAATAATPSLLQYAYAANGGDPYYVPSFVEGYAELIQEGVNDELVYPETYDDQEHGEARVSGYASLSSSDNKIKSIVLNKSCKMVGSGAFCNFTALEKLTFTYDGTEALSMNSFARHAINRDATLPLKEIYIYAPYVSVQEGTFRAIDPGFKIFVKNQGVKDHIVETTATGSYAVSEDQIEIMETGKAQSSFTITCEDIVYKTEGGLKPVSNITAGDGQITYKLYTDEECKKEYTGGYAYNSNLLQVGVYYMKGFMAETEEYLSSESPAIRVEVTAIPDVDKTALNQAIEKACTFFDIEDPRELITQNNPNKANYEAAAWNAAAEALNRADNIAKAAEGTYSQEEVVAAVTALTEAMDTLEKSPADTTTEWAALQESIQKAEGHVERNSKGEVTYTEASLKNLNNALTAAQALTKGTATKTQINSALEKLDAAIMGLSPKADASLEPFAFVKPGGKEVKIATLTADDKMKGAKKALLTIKCAEDVAFNQYSSIEVTVKVGSKSNYLNIKGTGDSTTGASYVVAVPLSEAVKEGDAIEVSAFTYAWNEAKDYVYGITKVELATEENTVLYVYTDKIAADESLAKKIDEADKMDLSKYTDASAAKVKEALNAAKALSADASAEDVRKALEALNAAMKDLEKKEETSTPTPSPSPTPGTTTQVIGVAKGQTFTVGNFTYKVTTAATITGTKKTAGAVSVTVLTKAGKKKSSVNVKNTVANLGASYNVTAIEKNAFKKAAKLKKATLGTNIKTIPANAFNGCKKLATVSAKGVTKVEKGAFSGCKVLKKLTLGKLSSVKKGAFKGCKKTIKISGGTKKVRKANVKKLKKSGYKKFK